MYDNKDTFEKSKSYEVQDLTIDNNGHCPDFI